MALLQQSFLMQSHCLNCEATQSSNLVSISHITHGKRLLLSSRKTSLEERAVQFARRDSCQHYALKVAAKTKSDLFVVRKPKKVSSYLFRTETGDQLKVFVEDKTDKYIVHVEILSKELDSETQLSLIWGLYRSDSSNFMPLNGKHSTLVTPFVRNSSGKLVVELEFEPSLSPFYVSFLLKLKLNSDSKTVDLRSHRKTNFVVPIGFSSGCAFPLGISFSSDNSINFSLFSRSAESVVLCLYDDLAKGKPSLEIELDPYVNRTGDIWHALIDNTIPFVKYGYRCKGGIYGKGEYILLDPYAKLIGNSIPAQHGFNILSKSLGILEKEVSFDWSSEIRPNIPMEKLIIYRLNVTDFTKDKSSNLHKQIAGTFTGITEKLQHLKDLGVNAVLLEPILPFDEKKGPYFPSHFFSPSNLYGPSQDHISVINSMKEMVKNLHINGVEVFLEVVFTHTSENSALGHIDNSSYYHNESDNRNSLNCNNPIVQQMILDSLRQWVIEYHIDGFCFHNSSSLLKGVNGEILSRPPLIEAIAFDPILSKMKLISDTWDSRELNSKETLFPHWRRWAEINTKFCHDVRNFLRGKGLISDLATRLCGSGDIFLNGRGPAFSFNYIASNFGLPLVDLVSFSSFELASQLSWNCGEEGPTNKVVVLETRVKQIRNFLFILFISLGVPVLNMGDECGQSSNGSPFYHDRKPLNWKVLKTTFGIQTTQFISFLSTLRIRRSDIFQRKSFLKEENIEWHGNDLSPPNWEDITCKFLGMTLKADISSDSEIISGDLFIALNASNSIENVVLPQLPKDMGWFCLVDTALPYPGFYTAQGVPVPVPDPDPVDEELLTYEMDTHSCVLFEAKSLSV